MSHAATHWLATVPPKTLTHGEFRVLFHLCDCHNPSQGCFPKQKYLRAKTGASNGGLNKWLLGLEDKYLISRERCIDPVTNYQMTRYTLAFEFEGNPENGGDESGGTEQEPAVSQTPSSGEEQTPQNGEGQTPLLGGANSTFEGGKLHTSGVSIKDKPVIEPVKEPYAGKPAGDSEDLFEKFFGTFPNAVERRAAEREWKKALARGADGLSIINAAANYAETKEVRRGFVKKPANWLGSDAWRDHVKTPTTAPTKAEIDANTATLIKSGNRTVAQQVSSHRVSELLHAGLISIEDCQRVGLRT